VAMSLRKGMLHEELEWEATHDRLTGLVNRATLERLAGPLVAARRDGVSVVAMLDLDGFKEINDTLGHFMGDRLLMDMTARVAGVLETDDVFARFGGDEFAIVADRVDRDAAARLLQRVTDCLRQPFVLDGLTIAVSGSIGAALAPDHGESVGELLRGADLAMYRSKREQSGWELYRSDLDRRAADRLNLPHELRGAIGSGELEVEFQPVLEVATGAVVAAETIVGWRHPTRGLIPHALILPIAERTGLVRQLGGEVLGQALVAARRWSDAGYDLAVTVNLSKHDLLDELLADRVARALEVHRLDPRSLVLEVAEPVAMTDETRTIESLVRLHRIGVRLVIDDFGVGYSSLAHLRRLPVDGLKIDRSLVASLGTDGTEAAVIRSVIDVARNLGLRVVAEGVEHASALEELARMGCELVQGSAVAPPLPLERFTDRLSNTTPPVGDDPGVPGTRPPQQPRLV
jgi:diguanylate cyclase